MKDKNKKRLAYVTLLNKMKYIGKYETRGSHAVKMSMFIFWIVKPHGLVGRYQRCRGTYCLHLQSWELLRWEHRQHLCETFEDCDSNVVLRI
jgi:hypothetical protein